MALGILLKPRNVPPSFVRVFSFKAVGMSAGSQGIQADCIKKFGKDRAGVVSSTNFIGMDIGNVIGPILGSVVVEKHGYRTMYWGYGALTLIAGSLIYMIVRLYEKKREAAA